MHKKIVLIIFSCCFFVHSNNTHGMHPSLQSFLFPGWGQTTLNNKKHARTFTFIELTLWATYLGSYTFSKHQKFQYQSFAANHASVNTEYKNHDYWVDIGNYIDIDHHNEEHLRWRIFDELYTEKDSWYWDSHRNMKKFENMRIKSDMLKKNCEYIIGAMTLNRILSAIDSLYLLRSLKTKKIAFFPIIGEKQNGLKFVFKI